MSRAVISVRERHEKYPLRVNVELQLQLDTLLDLSTGPWPMIQFALEPYKVSQWAIGEFYSH